MRYFLKKNNHSRRRAFTLMEILMVSVILSVISLALFKTFDSGIKVWQRVNRKIPETDVNILFFEFARDLRNSFNFAGTEFLGKENEVNFTALVNSERWQKNTIGRVGYFFDSNKRELNRRQADYSQVYEEKSGISREFLKNIKSFHFRYYAYDAQRKEYLWGEEWQKKTLPLAIRMEIEVVYDEQTSKFVKTVNLPASGRL